MVRSEIKTNLSPAKVWNAWKRAFEMSGGSLTPGQKSKGTIRFHILEVIEGKSYSILWKSFLTKILYTYRVSDAASGALIEIIAKPKGFFFWIVHLTLKKKIQRDLDSFLRDFTKALQTQS